MKRYGLKLRDNKTYTQIHGCIIPHEAFWNFIQTVTETLVSQIMVPEVTGKYHHQQLDFAGIFQKFSLDLLDFLHEKDGESMESSPMLPHF